jgi:protoporphyrinogen IX oxidase
MLWVKAFHIIFVTSWFAGLFYLPRIFVNLALTKEPNEIARLILMADKLYRFMLPLAVLALGFGTWLWLGYGIGQGPSSGWMHAKLFIVLILVAYHYFCSRLLRRFKQGRNVRSHVWYRFFNEIPVVLLAATCILVVVKPF